MHTRETMFNEWYVRNYERDSFESDEVYYDHRATARAGWEAALNLVDDILSGSEQ